MSDHVQMNSERVYISDGVYAQIRDGELVLTTWDGVEETNRIVLCRRGWTDLVEFIEKRTMQE